jgi:hypothetical protein
VAPRTPLARFVFQTFSASASTLPLPPGTCRRIMLDGDDVLQIEQGSRAVANAHQRVEDDLAQMRARSARGGRQTPKYHAASARSSAPTFQRDECILRAHVPRRSTDLSNGFGKPRRKVSGLRACDVSSGEIFSRQRLAQAHARPALFVLVDEEDSAGFESFLNAGRSLS